MNFVNTKSMIAHYPNCRFISRISDENISGYDSIFEARRDGYRQCRCCDSMARRLNDREEEMTEFCRRRAISYEIENGELLITTPYSEWKACVGNNNRLTLYHRNTRGDINKYHLQTDRYSNVISVLKYIDRHDSYRMNNPLPKPRKKKAPPRKGTKRYRAAERRTKEKNRRRDIRNVLELIESLSFTQNEMS